ncbi:MAG: hypothetical protein KC964_20570, partial [Candidatus Omnitrophica bacterium]|nr:hypothetical protein [Candidatus Omnitrophota bacterium]
TAVVNNDVRGTFTNSLDPGACVSNGAPNDAPVLDNSGQPIFDFVVRNPVSFFIVSNTVQEILDRTGG